MLKYIPIIALLIAGCARTTTMPMSGQPAPTRVDPAQNMPTFEPQAAPVVSGPQVYTGDEWEMRVPNGWNKIEREGAEIVLCSEDKTVTASLIRYDFDRDLPTLAIRAQELLIESGASLATKRTGFINTRSTIQLEFTFKDGIAQTNLFTTGEEAFVFTCGGKEETFDHNLILCNGLLRGLYIGHAQ
jgi:hypothetical protein